jgi:predicted negative regulator of RcsB-dependent stress response
LETVLNEFEGTPSSSVAGYYLGKMKYESGDVTQAEQYLTEFFNHQPIDIMVSSAALMLSDIDAQGNNMDGAVSYLDQGMKKSRDAHTYRMLELSKARLILRQGDLEGARVIVDGLLANKDLNSDQKQDAEEILGNIVG